MIDAIVIDEMSKCFLERLGGRSKEMHSGDKCPPLEEINRSYRAHRLRPALVYVEVTVRRL